jgi:quinol-cytochrome oxidoreductase complex cytochrome b subunit/mono/diheme cytochrome c family protein
VFARLRDWIDNRTGYRRVLEVLLIEHIPGGARWRYVWGSCLAFVFLVQLITGVLLMTAYSPGTGSAWGSVYFIQYQMDFGWLIRGLHHFGSQTMVVLLGVHMLQVVIAGAQLPPREFNWWLGMLLLAVVLGLSLTGYLLPWDQKGYWATQVATTIAGNLPVVGSWLQKVVVGGPAYGNQTLTHFYALHVGILPPLTIALIIAHLVVFRRHGVTVPAAVESEGEFWPEQAFRDMLVSLAIFAVMLFLVLQGHGHPVEAPATGEQGLYERWAHAGREGLGANLDAPADPEQSYPARPEWYFLFLFELLKFFPGDQEIIGTVVIPQAAAALLFVLPLLGYGWMRRFGHVIGVVVMVALLGGAAALTFQALADDTADPLARAVLSRVGTWLVPAGAGFFLLLLAALAVLPRGGFRRFVYRLGVLVLVVLLGGTGYLAYAALHDQVPDRVAEVVRDTMRPEEKATPSGVIKFNAELKQAEKSAARAVNLAAAGGPAAGSVYLLRGDPVTRFRGVFLGHCASCHSYGEFIPADFKTSEQQGFEHAQFKASDLAGFGTKEWLHDFLLDPGAKRFLGRAVDEKGKPHFKRMARWVKGQRKEVKKEELDEDFGKIAAWLATSPRTPPAADSPHAAAYPLFAEKYNCLECHAFDKNKGQENVPTLTGYGSATWLRMMIRAPGLPHLYGKNNLNMPAFRDLQGLTAEEQQQEYAAAIKKDVKDIRFADLSDLDREILIRYFTRDYRVIFGGEPITAAPKE